MSFNFEQPITAYELIAIILSVFALIIPSIKFVYNKLIKRLKIDFLPSGMITLYFNKSGAYISLGGVYEAKNKDATVKEISSKITRQSDNSTLSLNWSTFPSPVYREFGGKYETTFETAHPFKVDADTLYPVFIEFSSPNDNMSEITNEILSPLNKAASTILNRQDINLTAADTQIKQLKEYRDAQISINDNFFWKPGSYILELTTKYNNLCMSKKYVFDLSNDESTRLRKNIDMLLVQPVATHFGLNITISTVRKAFVEEK